MGMKCRACGFEHGLLTCGVAAARRAYAEKLVRLAALQKPMSVVVHAAVDALVGSSPSDAVVVHESTSPLVSAETPGMASPDTLAGGGTKHGRYADPEARKAYRRAWVKSDRAKKRAAA